MESFESLTVVVRYQVHILVFWNYNKCVASHNTECQNAFEGIGSAQLTFLLGLQYVLGCRA